MIDCDSFLVQQDAYYEPDDDFHVLKKRVSLELLDVSILELELLLRYFLTLVDCLFRYVPTTAALYRDAAPH
jgi:hypothetical protein